MSFSEFGALPTLAHKQPWESLTLGFSLHALDPGSGALRTAASHTVDYPEPLNHGVQLAKGPMS